MLRKVSVISNSIRLRCSSVPLNIVTRSNSITSSLSSLSSSLSSLLSSTADYRSLVSEERVVLGKLHTALQSCNAPIDDLDLIADTRARIDDLFMLVIVGEFNAGKSTFINALLGERYCKEGILPTTDKICIMRSNSKHNKSINTGWRRADNMLLDDVQEMDLPLDWMEDIAIIDTPGTNAIISRHQQLTQQIVPRADLVLFVTSAERPITESESQFLTKIKQWGKKVVIIVNKIDILENDKDREELMSYVGQNVGKIIGSMKPVPVFGISSKLALSSKLVAKDVGDPALGVGAKSYHDSKIEDVEKYLMSTLGKEELLRNKLENPLNVADRMIADSIQSLDKRAVLVEGDRRILAWVDENMDIFM